MEDETCCEECGWCGESVDLIMTRCPECGHNLDDEDDGWVIIMAEDGEEFQEYMDNAGRIVPAGTPVGLEKGKEFIMLKGIFYSSEGRRN